MGQGQQTFGSQGARSYHLQAARYQPKVKAIGSKRCEKPKIAGYLHNEREFKTEYRGLFSAFHVHAIRFWRDWNRYGLYRPHRFHS